MEKWATTKDLLNGYMGYPQISLQTQSNLRREGKIQYVKLGRNIYYKQAWVEEYIKSNIRPVQTEKDVHAS